MVVGTRVQGFNRVKGLELRVGAGSDVVVVSPGRYATFRVKDLGLGLGCKV